MAARIGLAGDVMLGRKVDERQRHRDVEAVWGDVLPRLRALDGFVMNLECCLSDRGRPWRRTHRPFHFRADPERAVPALQRAGVDCCALANNHVLDFETPALEDTLEHLDGAGVERAGAGRTLDEALEPGVFEAADLSVAVVSLTDNTPEYAADEDAPGTARLEVDVDDPETRRTVRTALERARGADPDLLVASLHWGPNMVEEPPEGFRRFGRWLVEAGVDLVHGHSAHVFQGVEVHEGVPICYDTGDFVDDYRVDLELRNDRSFLFEVRATADRVRELRLQPVEIDDCAVHLADGQAAEWCRETMRRRSADMGTTFETEGDGLVVDVA